MKTIIAFFLIPLLFNVILHFLYFLYSRKNRSNMIFGVVMLCVSLLGFVLYYYLLFKPLYFDIIQLLYVVLLPVSFIIHMLFNYSMLDRLFGKLSVTMNFFNSFLLVVVSISVIYFGFVF